jgi:uncharacterized protein involved in response to NO
MVRWWQLWLRKEELIWILHVAGALELGLKWKGLGSLNDFLR